MGFLDPPKLQRQVDGNHEAKILVLGDIPDGWSLKDHRPFSGPAETILLTAMQQGQVYKNDLCMTNFVWDKKELAKFWRADGAKGPSQLKGDIKEYREALKEFLDQHNFEIIVTLGEFACYAVLGKSKITAIRGYPYETKTGIKVIPSLPPRDMIRGNYVWRHYLAHDLGKAKRVLSGEVEWCPEFTEVIPDSFDQAVAILEAFKTKPIASIDIEVSNFEVSCIGFAENKDVGYTIPFDERWTEGEEVILWKLVADVLENRDVQKLMQNGIFDIGFLALKMGIFTTGYEREDKVKMIDTMMAHSIIYPDFLKGLGFLGSIYTCHPYWKDELEDKSIKDEN